MIYIVMREHLGSTLLLASWLHLFLALGWTFLTKYDTGNSISNPNKFLQIYTLLKQICESKKFVIFLENITF